MTERLHPEDLRELARLIAEELRAQPAAPPAPSPALLDVVGASQLLGSSPAFVRRHAEELGGRRLGAGSRARWRFDRDELLERAAGRDEAPTALPRRRRRASPSPLDDNVALLPIRGREA